MEKGKFLKLDFYVSAIRTLKNYGSLIQLMTQGYLLPVDGQSS